MRIIISLLIVFAVVAFWVLRPIRDTDFSLVGFIPLRKDALAARFAPLILPHEMYGTATRLYYRMAKDDEGKIYIA
ncbi:MAG TPA: hypothetical protein PLY93_00610, partial [Turneriella sp.]|nr:hypothetical protein [Turneriella sp.]